MLDASVTIRREPKNPDGYKLRGYLYGQQEQNHGAIEAYTSALSAPASENAASRLKTGRLDLALANCENALSLNSNAIAAYLGRAEYYLRTSSANRAAEEIGRAVRIADTLNEQLGFRNDTWNFMPTAIAYDSTSGPR
jgi:Tfp pilus assembly protein PilF